MKITVEIDAATLRRLVLQEVRRQLGEAGENLLDTAVRIEVKSKQNFKAEWEDAEFRARTAIDC